MEQILITLADKLESIHALVAFALAIIFYALWNLGGAIKRMAIDTMKRVEARMEQIAIDSNGKQRIFQHLEGKT